MRTLEQDAPSRTRTISFNILKQSLQTLSLSDQIP